MLRASAIRTLVNTLTPFFLEASRKADSVAASLRFRIGFQRSTLPPSLVISEQTIRRWTDKSL
jgi:hypothetical protein